jgi:asparagine synthase (glutamine-hydrolysing)
MAARGPDGTGEWWSESHRCALGHRRLAIIDLSDRAAQPMVSDDNFASITFNGEIYNYRELRDELIASGAVFRTTSDTEVLLHLYARHGRDMVQRLRGMFAFAIFDSRRTGLLLARDPLGIKPLYYSDDGWTFRFASQVKALQAGGRISRDIEPAGLTGFCLYGSVPEPFTIYRDIQALPAGHTLWVGEAGLEEPRPYASVATILKRVPGTGNIVDVEAEIREAVLDSVKAHLCSDVEVGLFLSSGIDSTALLGLMREAGQREIRAITLSFAEFQGTQDDEAPLAALAARKYGAHHIVRSVGRDEFRQEFGRFFDSMDQPSIDGVNTWFVAKAAHERGLKVALSGLGGDELLGGYPSFSDIPRWHRRFGPLSSIPGLGAAFRTIVRRIAPDQAKTQPKALGLFEFSKSWAGTYLLRRGLFLPFELCDILDPDTVREGLRRLRPLHRIEQTIEPNPGSDFARVSALEMSNYMRNQLLRDADWAGMAHSIEIRTPLVDVALLRRLAPLSHLLKPGQGKASLANAPSPPLPDEITKRAKTGFSVPISAWMADHGGEASARPSQSAVPKGLVARAWSQTVLAAFRPLEGAW